MQKCVKLPLFYFFQDFVYLSERTHKQGEEQAEGEALPAEQGD